MSNPALRSGSYRRRAVAVVAAAYADPSSRCWRCGRTLGEEQAREPGRAVSWQAGHVVDSDPWSPLAAEHSTCNARAGQVLGQRRGVRRLASLPALGSGRSVVLVVGAPGSGKSSAAARLPGVHLEREQFGSDPAFRAEVARVCRADGAVASVVRCCFSLEEQAEWVELAGAGEVVVCDPGLEECVRRVRARGRRQWRGEVAAVHRWYERRAVGELNPSRRWY